MKSQPPKSGAAVFAVAVFVLVEGAAETARGASLSAPPSASPVEKFCDFDSSATRLFFRRRNLSRARDSPRGGRARTLGRRPRRASRSRVGRPWSAARGSRFPRARAGPRTARGRAHARPEGDLPPLRRGVDVAVPRARRQRAAKPHRSVAPSAARLGRPSASTDPAETIVPSRETPRDAVPPRACGDPGDSKKPRGAGRPRGWRRDCAPPRRVSSWPRSRDDCWPNRESRDGVTTETLCGVSFGKSPARGVGLATIGLSCARADVAMVSSRYENASSPSGASRRVKTRSEPAVARRARARPRAFPPRPGSRRCPRRARAPWRGRARPRASTLCHARRRRQRRWLVQMATLVSTKAAHPEQAPRADASLVAELDLETRVVALGDEHLEHHERLRQAQAPPFAASFGSASPCPGPLGRVHVPLTDLSCTRRRE